MKYAPHDEKISSGTGVNRSEKDEANTIKEKVALFKTLLLNWAAKLINIAPDEISDRIDEGLRIAGRHFTLDLMLIEFAEDGRTADMTHVYSVVDPKQSPPKDRGYHCPWTCERVRRGETIVMDFLPHDLPPDAVTDRDWYLGRHYRSAVVLALPSSSNGLSRGFLIVASTTRIRWTEDQVDTFHSLGEILSSVLEQKYETARIREDHEFERLLSEVSAKYINLPVDEIEYVARNDFGRLARLLGVDRCVLHLMTENKERWVNGVYQWERYFAWWSEECAESGREEDQLINHEPASWESMQYLVNRWSNGQISRFTHIDELPENAGATKALLSTLGIKSSMSVPITVAGSLVGAIAVSTVYSHRSWPDDLVSKLRLFGEVFVNALVRKRSEASLRNALAEVESLRKQIESDYTYLKEEITLEHDFREIVGNSNVLKQIILKVKQVAPINVNVLLLGETGTGKGLIARAIHDASNRKDRPLVQVNCAALTPALIESEFFGYEKGAFTGAQARRPGRFEVAHGTTLFLDEIGEIPLELQAKLLRVLQDGEFERVGGSTTIRTDVRVIAATNKNLEKEVAEGRFRQDLWYRLNVFPIQVPPLRERVEDIPLFVNHFVDKYSKWMGKRFNTISQKTMKALQGYSWPGNIRELENYIERAVITSQGEHLQVELPGKGDIREAQMRSLKDFERHCLLGALEGTGWIINGPAGAAARLGLKPSTLRSKMLKLKITRPGTKTDG